MELEGPMRSCYSTSLTIWMESSRLTSRSARSFAYKAEWEKHHKPEERYGPPGRAKFRTRYIYRHRQGCPRGQRAEINTLRT